MSGDKEYEKFCRIRHTEERGILTEVVIVGTANDLQCEFFEVNLQSWNCADEVTIVSRKLGTLFTTRRITGFVHDKCKHISDDLLFCLTWH